MWLVERLPKEVSEVSAEVLSSGAQLARQGALEIKRRLSYTWTPASCKRDSTAWRDKDKWHLEGAAALTAFAADPVVVPAGKSADKATHRYHTSCMKLLTEQPPMRHNIPASVIGVASAEASKAAEWEVRRRLLSSIRTAADSLSLLLSFACPHLIDQDNGA